MLALLVYVIFPILTVTALLLAIRFLIRSVKEKPKEPKIEPKRDIAEELKKLAELQDQGILTDEEFDELKKRLLR
jgi:uncharacterized membrane protein